MKSVFCKTKTISWDVWCLTPWMRQWKYITSDNTLTYVHSTLCFNQLSNRHAPIEIQQLIKSLISQQRKLSQQGRRQESTHGVFLISFPPVSFLPQPPCVPFPFPTLCLPLTSRAPLNQLEGMGERWHCKLPQRGPNLVHSKAVRKPQVAIVLSILKCMFYITWSEKLD